VQTAFTGQIGPAQLANGSPLKRQLEGAYRANQAAVPRTVQMTLGGHPVTVVPLGSPGSKGQTLYDVQWRGVTVQTAFNGQIGPEQFKTGSPLKKQLEQAFRATATQQRAPSDASNYKPGDRIGTPEGELTYVGRKADGNAYVSSQTTEYRVPPNLRSKDEIRAWAIRAVTNNSISSPLYGSTSPVNVGTMAYIARSFRDGTVWQSELQQISAQVIRLSPPERSALVNQMARETQGTQSLLDAWLGEVTMRGPGGYGGLNDASRKSLLAHLVVSQDPVNLERVFHGLRDREAGERDNTTFQMEFVQQVSQRGTVEQRLGLLERLSDDAVRGDGGARQALAQLVARLPDRAAVAQALDRLDRRATDAMVAGAVTWRNEVITSQFGGVAVITQMDTRLIEPLARAVAATGNPREKAAFVASAGALLGRLRSADVKTAARDRAIGAVASAMSTVIGSDVNGVIENTLLQNDREGASSGRLALRNYIAAIIDSKQGAHLGAIVLSLQRGNDLGQDPMHWLSSRQTRTGDAPAHVRAAVMGDWLGLVGSVIQSRISDRDEQAAYASMMMSGTLDGMKELAGAAFPALKLPVALGVAVLKPSINRSLLDWRSSLARKDREFVRNLYEAALPHHTSGVEARGDWVTTMNAQYFASLQRQ
jgi:hypothetical protein